MKAEKEMIGGCCVCGEEQADQENLLVYCDGEHCTVGVHQNCYGVTKIPKGDWFCTPCRHSIKSPRCELCPSSTGAFKRTTSKQWAHVICALYFPDISFVNNVLMEPIELEGLHPDVFEKICMLCKNEEDVSYGACVTCNYPNCKNSFHITCGQREGCLCEEIDGKKSSKKDSVKYASYTCYCLLHIKKILDISKISKEVVYKVLPKFNPPKPSTSSSKANSSLINKSSPINLSSSSTSSRDSSPTGSTMKKPDSDRLHISKVDRNSKSVSKDLRLSKKVSSSHKIPPCSQSNNGYMNGSNTALTSAAKFDNCSRSSSKGSKNSSSSSGFSSSSNNSVTSKLSKIDKTLTISESGSKHRIGSPSATMANQPPRKRTHSSSSSSGKSSSSSSDSDSGSESSSSDSSSSSKSSSKKAHHSSSSSSSSDSSNSSSSSESDGEKEQKNKCHVNAESSPVSKKALKKSRLIFTEPAATKLLSRQEQSKKMKLKHDSSSNNPSSESLSTSLTDKLKSSKSTKRDRSSSTSMASKKEVNVDKVKAKSGNSESSSNSVPKSVVSSAISTLITASSSKQFSQLLLSEDSEPEEPLKSEKKLMKQPIPNKSKKSSSVLTSRSSKGAPRSILSESSAESEAGKSDSEFSDDEKAKHRSDEDPFASKLTKKVFVKKSFSPEKKPRGLKTVPSSSYKSKENFCVDEPTTKVTNKKSPTKKEPSENSGSKSKQSIKDMSDSAPATASRKRRNSPSKALKSTSKNAQYSILPHNGISTITKECESDCKSMSSSVDRSRSKKVADSLSQVVSSPIDHQNGAIKAFPFSAIISPGASQSTSSNHNLPDNNLNIIIPASLSKTVMVHQHLASPPPPTVVAASAQPPQFPLHLERPPTPKSLEDLLEFQWINTSHFLLDQEENHDVAMLIQKLNSLVQENVQLERNLHTLNDSYSNLVSVNSRLKNLVMTDLSLDQPSQITELTGSNDTPTFGNLPVTLSVVSVSSASKPLPGHGTMMPSLARPTVPPSTSLQHLSQSRYSASSAISPAVISSASLIPLLTTSAVLSSAVTSSSSPSVYSSSSALPSNSSAQLPTANTSLTNLLATTNHFMNNHQAATSSPYLYNSHATASDILNDVAIASRDRQETAFATSTTDAASSNTMTSSLYSQFINGKSSTCAIPHSNLIGQHSLSSTSNSDRQHGSAAAPFLNQLMAVASSNAHAHPSHFIASSGGAFESQDMSNIGRPAVIARNNGGVSVSESSSNRHYGNLSHVPNGSANAQPSHFYSHH